MNTAITTSISQPIVLEKPTEEYLSQQHEEKRKSSVKRQLECCNNLERIYIKTQLDKNIKIMKLRFAFHKIYDYGIQKQLSLQNDIILAKFSTEQLNQSNYYNHEIQKLTTYYQQLVTDNKINFDNTLKEQINKFDESNLENQKLKASIDTLTEENDKLVIQLQQQKEINNNTNEDLKCLHDQNNKLQTEFYHKSQQYEFDILKEQNKYDSYVQNAMNRYDNIQNNYELQIIKLKRDSHLLEVSAESKIFHLQHQNKQLYDNEVVLNDQLSESINKYNQLNSEMTKLQNNNLTVTNSFQNQLDDLQSEIMKYKGNSTHFKTQEHDYKKVIHRLTAFIRKQKDAIITLKTHENVLVKELIGLKNTTQQTIQHKESYSQDIINENIALKTKICDLTNCIDEQSNEIIQKTNSENLLSDHIKVKTKMLEDQNDLIHDLRTKLGSYDNQIKNLKRDLKDSETYLEDLKIDISYLDNQLKLKIEIENNLNDLVSQLQFENTVCDDNNRNNSITKSNSISIDRLQNEITSLQTVIGKLHDDINILNGSNTQMQRMMDDKNEELVIMKSKITILESDRIRLDECIKEDKVRMIFNILLILLYHD